MLSQREVQEKDAFIEDHEPYVRVEHTYYFIDGAVIEGDIQLIEPPDDDQERLQNKAKYWQVVSTKDELAFELFKNYLQGSGQRQDEWAKLYTEADQIAHLRKLKEEAKRSAAKYLKIKRELNAAIPEWMSESDEMDAEVAARHNSFLDDVEKTTL